VVAPERLKAMEIPVYPMAVISTAHITKDDGASLRHHRNWRMQDEWSDLLAVPPASEMDEFEASSEGFSPEFIALMKLIREKGFEYVRFDADGDVIEGLPTIEW